MVDVAVASQLQQWSFAKPAHATRPERSGSDSSASSPLLCDDTPETLRIDTTTPERSDSSAKESVVLQERYMSSEEDLSPADDGSDSEYDYEDAVIHDAAKECKARTMSISRWEKGRSCDMAVMVSYAFVGRPKVVELQDSKPNVEAMAFQTRSASLAHLPVSQISQLRKADAAQRMSMKATPTASISSAAPSRPASPPAEREPSRRPSTSHSPSTSVPSTLQHTEPASTTSSFRTAPSSRSISPAVDDILARPVTAVPEMPSSARSSVYISSQSRTGLSRVQTSQSSKQSQWAPNAPASTATHAFLSSDPYETSNTHSASPIIKPAPHKRLRSISLKLALAKISIAPSKKSYDTRVDGKMPTTPATPQRPHTPMTAPIQGNSSFVSPNKLRRASTILRPRSRHGEASRGPSPENAPPVPSIPQHRLSRMQARGASEIEPTLVLPPCPSDSEDDPVPNIKNRRLTKRKSLMSLMDAL